MEYNSGAREGVLCRGCWGGGGGGVVNFCEQILRQIETENRAIAYALS